MYNVRIEMPRVSWSTVPGMQSRGYDRKEIEDAEELQSHLQALLVKMQMPGCFVLILEDGREIKRTEIVLDKSDSI